MLGNCVLAQILVVTVVLLSSPATSYTSYGNNQYQQYPSQPQPGRFPDYGSGNVRQEPQMYSVPDNSHNEHNAENSQRNFHESYNQNTGASTAWRNYVHDHSHQQGNAPDNRNAWANRPGDPTYGNANVRQEPQIINGYPGNSQRLSNERYDPNSGTSTGASNYGSDQGQQQRHASNYDNWQPWRNLPDGGDAVVQSSHNEAPNQTEMQPDESQTQSHFQSQNTEDVIVEERHGGMEGPQHTMQRPTEHNQDTLQLGDDLVSHEDESVQDVYTEPPEVETRIMTPSTTAAPVSIVLMGRSGSGVSSTIRELIGPLTKCPKPAGKESFRNILEYTISNITSPSGDQYAIKLIDIPGFVDGRTLEQDAEILASLKSYLHEDAFPKFFLAVSRFDDNRIAGQNSLFVQLLQRVQLFQKVFLHKSNVTLRNTAFLLTRLMSETKQTQRKPGAKIESFRKVIEDFTSFPQPIRIAVGENNAGSEYDLRIEDGYYRLPNKEHYPKNIWQLLLNVSSDGNEGSSAALIQDTLTSVMNGRETEMTCETRLVPTEWKYFEEDTQDFMYLLQKSSNWTVEDTELNNEINTIFSKLSPPAQFKGIVQKTVLQLRLQDLNITKRADLPDTNTGKAEFFQVSQVSSGLGALILSNNFGMKMPEYIQALSVGYGYALMSDELSPQTPFRTDRLVPSSTGYEIPSFMKCRKLLGKKPLEKSFKLYIDSMSDYFKERLEFLTFPNKENVSLTEFTGKVKEAFNIKPDEDDNSIVTLSAIKEIRIVKCTLSTSQLKLEDLDQEFVDSLNVLKEFKQANRDNVNEWQNFFERFGSHVVSEGYGGGSLHGNLVGSEVEKVLASRRTVDDTLSAILTFSPFPYSDLGSPKYRLFGGEREAAAQTLYDLEESNRTQLLERWTESLKSDFVMLNYELELEPISSIAGLVNKNKGDMVERAIGRLLMGELRYVRKQRNNNGTGRNPNRVRSSTTQRPTTRTRRPTTPTYLPIPDRSQGHRQEDNNERETQKSIQQGSGNFNPTPTSQTQGNNEQMSLLKATVDNQNFAIDLFEQQVESKKETEERRYREQMTQITQRQQQEEERHRQQAEDLKRVRQAEKEKRDRFFGGQIDNIEKDAVIEKTQFENHLEEIRRHQEQLDREHQLRLELIRKQNEEERKRQEEANRCKWGFLCGLG